MTQDGRRALAPDSGLHGKGLGRGDASLLPSHSAVNFRREVRLVNTVTHGCSLSLSRSRG